MSKNRLAFPVNRFAVALLFLPLSGLAQAPTSGPEPAISGEQAAPAALASQHSVVRWSGALPTPLSGPSTMQMSFAIFSEQSGGSPLWSETQPVVVGADGRFSVLLGAATAEGLPQSLFPAGEPRWIEAAPVSAANKGNSEAEALRSLITAVPYAFHSVDAETLAGRSAADYVTLEDLKAFASGFIFPGGSTAATPGTLAAQPAISGTGTTNYLPIWTSSSAFGNSAIYQTDGHVGIGTTTPGHTLDVKGAADIRGTLSLPAQGTATKSAGYASQSLEFGASAYSSSSATPIAQTYMLQAVPVGNDTSTATSALALLYGVGQSTPAVTGFSIASNGKVSFAAGQTFPGTGDISSVAVTSPLTGGGTSGAVTVGLSTSALETTLNPVYSRLAAANTFTAANTFNSASTSYAVEGITSTGSGVEGYATGTGGEGIHGYSAGNGGIGVYAHSVGAANGSTYPIGVYSGVVQGTAIKAVMDNEVVGQSVIFGQGGGASQSFEFFEDDRLAIGVWGDMANPKTGQVFPIAVAGTTDDGYAGAFENDSDTSPTLFVSNRGTAGRGVSTSTHFDTLYAGNKNGTCGIGGNGSLSCTGQIKSLITTPVSGRTVETYSVQSPENWMEDFGSGKLSSGRAVIAIDPTFAETVSGKTDYHVFLTAKGESKNLYVTNETANSFEVHEAEGGAASIGFDYRIVAKRRGLQSQRLTDITEKFKSETKSALLGTGIAHASGQTK